MPANTPRGYSYPLYTDPANFPAQLQDLAQDIDVDVEAQADRITAALNAPSCRISATANQLIAVSTTTNATFAVEEYDNAAMANLGVNNDRITFTSTGIYLIHAECNWVPNGNATVNGRGGIIFANLGQEITWHNLRGAQNADVELSMTTLYQVDTVGDFIVMQLRQNSGGGANVSARSMSATKVAD